MHNENVNGRALKKHALVKIEGTRAIVTGDTSDKLIASALRLWEAEQSHIETSLARLGIAREHDSDWNFSGWIEEGGAY